MDAIMINKRIPLTDCLVGIAAYNQEEAEEDEILEAREADYRYERMAAERMETQYGGTHR